MPLDDDTRSETTKTYIEIRQDFGPTCDQTVFALWRDGRLAGRVVFGPEWTPFINRVQGAWQITIPITSGADRNIEDAGI